MTLQITPYLIMDGNANQAVEFYKQALEAEVLNLVTYGEMPEGPPDKNLKEHVAHAHLKMGEGELMFSDSPGLPVQKGNQVTICVTAKNVERAKQVFNALKQGGNVNAPFEKTSFSPAFGNVTDKFGVTFQILVEGPNDLNK